MKKFMILGVLLVVANLGIAKENNITIHYYSQIPALTDSSTLLVRAGVDSQLQGLLDLYRMVEKEPNLPIFDDNLRTNEDGNFSVDFEKKNGFAVDNIKKLKYEDLENHTLQSLKEIDSDTMFCIYAVGFVRALNVLRVESGRQPLNMVPTSVAIENGRMQAFKYIAERKKQLEELSELQTNHNLMISLGVYLTTSLVDLFLGPVTPSPFICTLLTASLGYGISSYQYNGKKSEYGLDKEKVDQLEEYLKKTYQEEFTQKQIEKYLSKNPEVKKIFLSFNAYYEFSKLQQDDRFESINPPKITKEFAPYDEDFDNLILDLLKKSF